MQAFQMPTEHHPVAMLLPMVAEFDRLLRVRVCAAVIDDHGESIETEHDAVLRVPCSKPATPGAPSAEDLHHLAPYERALRQVLDAQ